MGMGVAQPRSEDTRATEENFTGRYEPRSRRVAVSFNAGAHRELSNRGLSAFSHPPQDSDAVARVDTHPGLLSCGMQR